MPLTSTGGQSCSSNLAHLDRWLSWRRWTSPAQVCPALWEVANGIIFGIASNSFAKISEGFTKLTPSILCILFMCVTMFSIAKAMSALPVGFAYATYSGLTVTGVVLFAVLKFNQVPNLYGTIGIILIIIGVVMVNYLGKLN